MEYKEGLDEMNEIQDLLVDIDERLEVLDRNIISTSNTGFVKDDRESVLEVYKNYKNAMSKHSSYVLAFDRFWELVTESYGNGELAAQYDESHGCFSFGESMVHGFFKEGYFMVSHFAPASMREGVELIKELSSYDNVVFAVTEYLSGMLDKLGYNFITEVPQWFNDGYVMKKVYTSWEPSEKELARMANSLM